VSLVSTKQAGLAGFTKYRSLADASGNPVFNIPGMVLMKPTSITHSGTSATLGANGQVTFTAVTSLSLNGVFTADFDNYVLSVRDVGSGNLVIRGRLRTGGSDASGSDYTVQYLEANNTSVFGGRYTQSDFIIGATDSTVRSGDSVMIYGPNLAQPTATRVVNVGGNSSARITDAACTHSLSTAYDSFTIFMSSGNITGACAVYGIRS